MRFRYYTTEKLLRLLSRRCQEFISFTRRVLKSRSFPAKLPKQGNPLQKEENSLLTTTNRYQGSPRLRGWSTVLRKKPSFAWRRSRVGRVGRLVRRRAWLQAPRAQGLRGAVLRGLARRGASLPSLFEAFSEIKFSNPLSAWIFPTLLGILFFRLVDYKKQCQFKCLF